MSKAFHSPTRRLKILLAVGALVLTWPLGLLSNKVSQRACEDKVARWLYRDVCESKPLYAMPDLDPATCYPPQPAMADTMRIFRRIGAPVSPEDPSYDPMSFATYPQPFVGVGPFRSDTPFLVRVEFTYQLDALNGLGCYRNYIAFFGLPLYHWDERGWSS